MMRFFLDESGSTGDVARTEASLEFGGQPIFTLAAIGVSDEDDLSRELLRLASRHGLLHREIRSTALAHKPEFAADLAEWLGENHAPVFIEMMQKRFVIVMNIVNCVLLPPRLGVPEGGREIAQRRIAAELLSATCTDAVLASYARACETSHRPDLHRALHGLRQWSRSRALGASQEVMRALVSSVFKDFLESDGPLDHKRFLPLPDESVTGRPISMLPGLTALTNVYARINKYRQGRLADVHLIHDEHMLYGDILRQSKALMEELATSDAFPELPDADYRLRESATLSFVESSSPGVQAADVIAGFTMRFFRDTMLNRPASSSAVRAMASIMRLYHKESAQGINLVAPYALLTKAGFSHF